MSKKANPARIGAFVVGAVALVVAGILVFGSGRFFKEVHRYVAYFEGSVKGLNVGAPVVFRGVRIGQVTNIGLQLNTEDLSVWIPVHFEIEGGRFETVGPSEKPSDKRLRDVLIERGLRAQLQLQSLVTGQLMIELDMHPGTPVRLVGVHERGVTEVPTIPTKFQQLSQAIDQIPLAEIAETVKTAFDSMKEFIDSGDAKEGATSLMGTLEETRRLVRHLNERLDPMLDSVEEVLGGTRDLVHHVDAKVDPLAAGVEDTMKETQRLVRNLDARVGPLGDELSGTMRDTRTLLHESTGVVKRVGESADGAFTDTSALVKRLDSGAGTLLPELEQAVHDLRSAVGKVNETLSGIADTVSDNSALRHDLDGMVREVSGAARSLRILGDYLQQNPDALLRGKRAQ